MGKVVLVTGGSRGIGRAIVKGFAEEGYDVVIHYVQHKDAAESLKQEVEKKYGIRAFCVMADISKETEVKTMLENIDNTVGSLDVLVNNAGIAQDCDWQEKSSASFERVLQVNLLGTFLLCQMVGKRMLQQKQGTIINIASTNGIDTYYKEGMDYDASKAGVISLTHNFAHALAPYIRVNAIAPGWVNTDMTKDLSPIFRMEEERKILLERFAEPEEIAKVAVFLAKDEASYINNTILRVDGGY